MTLLKSVIKFSVTARLSLLFSYDKDKQIFYYSLLCVYTICSQSVPSSQHGCTRQKITSLVTQPSVLSTNPVQATCDAASFTATQSVEAPGARVRTATQPVVAPSVKVATQPVETPGVKVATQPIEAPGARPVVHPKANGATDEEIQTTRLVE